MQREMIPHRGATFRSFFSELLGQIKRVHGTEEGDVVVLPGTGSAGFEAAVVNTLSPGDEAVAFVTGDFGARFANVAERFGVNVSRVEVEWGKAATASIVRKALDEHPSVRAVLYTYNETSTGVTNPLQDIGPLVRRQGALLLVDAVSAAAGVPIEMDRWDVDFILSGSQKAWMCPPGLVIMGIGPRVWKAYERSSYPKFFWDLKTAVKNAAKGDTPTTAPLTLLYALKAACDMIEAEGLENVYARHAKMGAIVREGVTELGYRLFADEEYASDTVTAMLPPEGLSQPDIINRMRTQQGTEIAGGQAHINDTVLRIGHMGWVHEPELRRTLEALGKVTQRLQS
jgi:aspartate aminotransferase-like enzyme